MKRKPIAWLLAAASLLLSLSVPKTVLAVDLIVTHTPDPNDRNQFSSIQAAVNDADARRSNQAQSFRILVEPSDRPYFGPITPISNVPIIGKSTAETFIDGGGAGTTINLNGVTSVTIRNFTFRNASLAISVVNSSSIFITNNVFDLGSSATGVQVQNAPNNISIRNNTFFSNGTAISTNSNVEITNNIFASNRVAIAAQIPLTLSFNGFFSNTSNGVADLGTDFIPNPLHPGNNPLFVAPAEKDFHLQADSPAKGSGNPNFPNSFDPSSSDMGAYGGRDSNSPLSTVTGVRAERVEQPANSIKVSWDPTNNSSINAYRVHFGTSPRGTANSYPSTVLVPVPSTSTVLSNLSVTPPATPGTPAQVTVTSLNGALRVNWNRVEGATGYRVFYRPETTFGQSTLDSATVREVPGGDTTSTVIPNLSNGTTYFVAVAARAEAQIFLAVTAVINTGEAPSPGSGNESPLSGEVPAGVGEPADSPISTPRPEFPEAVAPFPDLPSKGCFIATAAYGFYSAPQVQVLREFRDRYLMTTGAGRALVAWYYRCGPHGAQFINAHPWLKPPVRLALLPLIVLALFLTGTTPLAKLAILTCAVLSWFYLRQRLRAKRRNWHLSLQRGGAQ